MISLYEGLFLADVHIGALTFEQTCKEIAHFKKLLKEYTKDRLLDFIIIGGDFFHKQMYSSDVYIGAAQRMMLAILASARIVRVVYGTSSHDSLQYHIFTSLIAELESTDVLDVDFRVITVVEEEELLPGVPVLYIPEEYIYNKQTYYDPYLSKKDSYAYIFGHGMIYEAFQGKIKPNTTETKRKRAPVFHTGELSRACYGDVIFGHYHIHSEFPGNVSYVGSLSRWCQGEEEEKGFYRLLFNSDKKKSIKEFVVNTEALRYITVGCGYNNEVFHSSDNWEPFSKKLLSRAATKRIFQLRVMFNIPIGYENPEALITFFRERFSKQDPIRVEFSHGYSEKKLKAVKERIDALPEEHRLFIDKNVPEEVKISTFLELKRGIHISPEVVKKFLETN